MPLEKLHEEDKHESKSISKHILFLAYAGKKSCMLVKPLSKQLE